MAPSEPALAAIVGPTAAGKSQLAMALARRLAVEIVVADSRQVYRGMEIGTAKPDAAARAAVPHHLLDLVDPDQPFTVADWVTEARRVLPEIAARGRLPLVVGGTGLYLRALIEGFDFGGGPPASVVRAELRAELEARGPRALATRLAALDPATAATIDRSNPRRVLAALERAERAGGPVRPGRHPYAGRIAIVGLSRPRAVLTARIVDRIEQMFERGLVEEVEALHAAGFGPQLRPLASHGYREAGLVAMGEWTRAEAIAATARRTRQYAKRQETWFRAEPQIVWLAAGEGPADDPVLVARSAELIGRMLAP